MFCVGLRKSMLCYVGVVGVVVAVAVIEEERK